MNARAAHALRFLTFVGAAVLIVGVLTKFVFAPESQVDDVDLKSDERTVRDAIWSSTGKPMGVRGYVFEGPGGLGLRLCEGRKPGDPPSCIGPFVELSGPAVGAVPMSAGDGVQWSDDPVTFFGVVSGTSLVAEQVLR